MNNIAPANQDLGQVNLGRVDVRISYSNLAMNTVRTVASGIWRAFFNNPSQLLTRPVPARASPLYVANLEAIRRQNEQEADRQENSGIITTAIEAISTTSLLPQTILNIGESTQALTATLSRETAVMAGDLAQTTAETRANLATITSDLTQTTAETRANLARITADLTQATAATRTSLASIDRNFAQITNTANVVSSAIKIATCLGMAYLGSKLAKDALALPAEMGMIPQVQKNFGEAISIIGMGWGTYSIFGFLNNNLLS